MKVNVYKTNDGHLCLTIPYSIDEGIIQTADYKFLGTTNLDIQESKKMVKKTVLGWIVVFKNGERFLYWSEAKFKAAGWKPESIEHQFPFLHEYEVEVD